MALKGFERRLERMVEGAFARVFRSGLRPVELGRRLVREMDDSRSVDVRGRTVVPNHFTVELSAEDHEQFAEIARARSCASWATRPASTPGTRATCSWARSRSSWSRAERMRTGAFQIAGRMREGAGGVGAGSLLLPTGDRDRRSARTS